MRKLALAFIAAFALNASALAQGVDSVTTTPSVFPSVDGGQQFSRLEPTQIFWDDFGTGTLDATNRWAAPTTGGGGNATAATNAVGATVLGSGNQASGWSILQSQPSFAGRNPGYVTGQWQVNVEFPILANAYRFWGFYTAPGSPTTSAPLTNAVGFAIDTAGKLRAQTWASGAININVDLSTQQSGPQLCNCVPQPTDAAVHKYQITFRGDNILWWIDGRLVAKVLTGAGGPDVNTLPTGALAIAGATPPTSTAVVQLNQVTIGDTSRNNIRVCDGTFSWRCATVSASGALSSSTSLTGSTSNASDGVATSSTNVPIVSYNYLWDSTVPGWSRLPGTVANGAWTVATSQYPKNVNGLAAATTNSATGTTGAVTATLAGVASKTTFICGFSITSDATAALAGTATIGGVTGGTMSFIQNVGSATSAGELTKAFSPCIPASAVNTAITVNSVAAGTGGNTAVNAWGYQL